MYDFLTSVLAMAVVLGVMIVVHEFGHFAAAKLLGVRVEVFSVGFGKRLLGFRRGDTDYRLSAIPLGGYVKMSGENPMEERSGDYGEFMSHPRWHRFIIAVAGPFMNVLLAVALLTGVFMVHYEHAAFLDEPAVVGHVDDGKPAQKAGLRDGDKIVRIGDKQNPSWEDVMFTFMLSPNRSVDVAVQRDGKIVTATVTPEAVGPNEIGDVGLAPARPVRIARVENGYPAANAGIKSGDEITALNGQPLNSIEALLDFLKDSKNTPVDLTILRNGQTFHKTVTPVLANVNGEQRYRLGFVSGEAQHVSKLPFGAALSKSLEQNKKNSVLIVELVQKMVRREVPMRQIEGPIGIARASGEAARQEGWTPLLSLMAAISLNLGIFNLFPIPILDGGVILLLLVEGVMRRDISQPIKERIYQAAFVFLVLFAVMVIYNDLVKAVPGLSQKLP